jgi:hypothetical protein
MVAFPALSSQTRAVSGITRFLMSFDEAAPSLGIAVPTARQWGAYARAWLTVELRAGPR